MKIGYARVSTSDQNLDLQRDALKAAGCVRIMEDTASGGKKDRTGPDRVREQLREGQGVGFFGALAGFERKWQSRNYAT